MTDVIKTIFLLVSLSSCSSSKVVIQGYEGQKLAQALSRIQGKSANEVLKILGKPAIHGLCKKCGHSGLYRIIYLKKDMREFYLNLSYKTDMEVNCFVLDLMPDRKLKTYVFDRVNGFYDAKNCNQTDGMILELQRVLEME